MAISRKYAVIYDECVACGCCAKVCPLNAITVYKGMYAVVNEEKCVGCGKCANTCPASVISIVSRKVIEDECKTEALLLRYHKPKYRVKAFPKSRL